MKHKRCVLDMKGECSITDCHFSDSGSAGHKINGCSSMSMIDLISVLDQIIEQKTVLPVFQPIVNIRQQNIHGYESHRRLPQTVPCTAPWRCSTWLNEAIACVNWNSCADGWRWRNSANRICPAKFFSMPAL